MSDSKKTSQGMKLKIIEGNRDELERKVLETIWLGSLEEADRLIAKLQTLPQPDLRLVSNRDQETKTENLQE